MEDEKELHSIFLKCIDCDNTHCKYGSLYILPDSKEGCTRMVDEDLFIDYQIQLIEKYPFIHMLKTQEAKRECYIKTIDILEQVYNSPLGHRVSDSGKILYQRYIDLEPN